MNFVMLGSSKLTFINIGIAKIESYWQIGGWEVL